MPPSEWPDLEALLISRAEVELLQDLDPAGEHQLEISTDLSPQLGEPDRWFLRLRVISGSDDGITEKSRVDVDAFAPDRGEAHDLAKEVRDWMEDLSGTSRPDGTGLVDLVATTQRPVWIDYRNEKIQCFQAKFQVSVREQ